MRTKPRFSYNGITLILSRPSRFDIRNGSLLQATGGLLLDKCLATQFNRHGCDIRTSEEKDALLPNTKGIILLGEDSAKGWLTEEQIKNNSLNEVRGSIFQVRNTPTICSYYPQDAADIKNFEKEFNKQVSGTSDADLEVEVDEDDFGEKSRKNRTRRKNYAFWLHKDIDKLKFIMANNGIIPSRPFEPEYITYPNSAVVIDELTKTKNEVFYIDIETDMELNILCFSFNFSSSKLIWNVPIIDHNYGWAYSNLPALFRALAITMRDNLVVAHNGAGFDFPVLIWKYHVPIGHRLYDTMIAEQRIFPDAEKSLGHCTSLWTYEPFHKDEGGGGYNNIEQTKQMWLYCGKDVFTMRLIHNAQLEYAKRRPGLMDSINQANASIRPYLTTFLQGIKYRENEVEEMWKENDRLMVQYIRFADYLVGRDTIKRIRGKSPKPMLNSNQQCTKYFHDELGYDIVARSKKTGKPSLAKTAMYKLKLKYENPVIDLCLAYREIIKESGSLKFTPWINNNERTVK